MEALAIDFKSFTINRIETGYSNMQKNIKNVMDFLGFLFNGKKYFEFKTELILLIRTKHEKFIS